jgi:MFS transporter, PAT family, beta-lactamase induction signal transducer AmpG
LLVTLAIPEGASSLHADEPVRFRELVQRLKEAITQPSSAALVLIVLTYKSGETLADGMWKPMLLDRGFTASDIGLWAGTYGMVASIVGSTAGGLIGRGMRLETALVWIASFRALGVAGEWWVSSAQSVPPESVIGVTCLEHLAGGALTTVLFALMMRHTDRQIGATHFTLLASLEVLGKMPFGALSGVVAQRLGYEALFATATALCVAFALLAQGVRARLA